VCLVDGNSNLMLHKGVIYIYIYTGCPRRKGHVVGGHSIGHSNQKTYAYMSPIPNGFRDTDISLYSFKIVDKKEILRSVFNTGIYFSSDKVGTVYLV
jgi:hypothetical protein